MRKLLLVANVSKEHIRKFHIPFIRMMREKGWQVDVACRLDEPVPECDHAFDLPCDRNPFRGGLLASVRVLRRVLRENHYDVVHCHTVVGGIIARTAAAPFRKDGLKVFYTNHGIHFFPGAPLSRWIMGYPLERLLAPKTDLLITINKVDDATARRYLSGCGGFARIHGIGVNLEKFRNAPLETDRTAYRRTLGLSPEDFVVTYVAELIPNKNQQMLLRSFAQVCQVIPRARLMLAGPDHWGGKLQDMASQMGIADRVLFLGWRSDVPRLLSCADAYAATSRSEGLGLNIIEAMACGLPVVACRNRGHCEIITDGVNGFLVDYDDADAMARRIIQFSREPATAEALVHSARAQIRKYETGSVLRDLERIYAVHLPETEDRR